MLVLLALVVVAGVALRVVDERRRDADQAADKHLAQQRADELDTRREQDQDAEEEPTATDDPVVNPDVSTGSGTSPALDEPLGISLETIVDPDGDPAFVVQHLGPIELGSRSSIPYVAGVLGEPDSIGANPDDADVCDASWVAYGLEARFYFGQPPSPAASCEKGPIAAALMTGDRWFIQPLTGGGRVIGVGDPVESIATAFPFSRRERLTPGLASLAENTHGYLVAEGSYAGDPFPTLYAIDVDGVVASFLYVSGAE